MYTVPWASPALFYSPPQRVTQSAKHVHLPPQTHVEDLTKDDGSADEDAGERDDGAGGADGGAAAASVAPARPRRGAAASKLAAAAPAKGDARRKEAEAPPATIKHAAMAHIGDLMKGARTVSGSSAGTHDDIDVQRDIRDAIRNVAKAQLADGLEKAYNNEPAWVSIREPLNKIAYDHITSRLFAGYKASDVAVPVGTTKNTEWLGADLRETRQAVEHNLKEKGAANPLVKSYYTAVGGLRDQTLEQAFTDIGAQLKKHVATTPPPPVAVGVGGGGAATAAATAAEALLVQKTTAATAVEKLLVEKTAAAKVADGALVTHTAAATVVSGALVTHTTAAAAMEKQLVENTKKAADAEKLLEQKTSAAAQAMATLQGKIDAAGHTHVAAGGGGGGEAAREELMHQIQAALRGP